MDGSQFRNLRRKSSANFKSILAYWHATMRAAGCWDLDDEIHYILALCYSLVGSSKNLQDVYRDAHLAPPRLAAEADELDDSTRARIVAIAQSQSRDLVQAELESVLGGFKAPAQIQPALREACRRWVNNGVVAMRARGEEGLIDYLRELDSWISKYRKRSEPWVRHFTNQFAYECKAAFHTCFANAWVGLIEWLKERRPSVAGKSQAREFNDRAEVRPGWIERSEKELAELHANDLEAQEKTILEQIPEP